MTKSVIIAGLLAIGAVAVSAAPVKTSKAVPLNDAQMQSVKGQGAVFVYLWVGGGYTLVQSNYIVDNYYVYQFTGGPRNGENYKVYY